MRNKVLRILLFVVIVGYTVAAIAATVTVTRKLIHCTESVSAEVTEEGVDTVVHFYVGSDLYSIPVHLEEFEYKSGTVPIYYNPREPKEIILGSDKGGNFVMGLVIIASGELCLLCIYGRCWKILREKYLQSFNKITN